MPGFISTPELSIKPYNDRFEGDSYWTGTMITAQPGTVTVYDHELTFEGQLLEGSFYVDKNARLGDWVEFMIVGVPDGSRSAYSKKYLESVYVVPGERRNFNSGVAAKVDPNVCLRVIYHSVGDTPVGLLVDWLAFIEPTASGAGGV